MFMKDPTLQRSSDIECPKCGYHEAVFFQVKLDLMIGLIGFTH